MAQHQDSLFKSGKISSLTLYHSGWERCNPSHSFGPAVRPHYLLHYVLDGKGYYYVNNQCHELKKGEGFLICPGDSTYYIADKETPWEYCWIGFDGYEAKTILSRCGLSKEQLVFTDKSNGSFKEIILTLIHNFENNQHNEYTQTGQLYLCFSALYEQYSQKPIKNGLSYTEKAIDYMNHNFSYDIKVSDMASYVGIDRTYLYKLFIETHKTSPQQYLIGLRLQSALHLLETSAMSVTEISYSCGFRDTPSFYKHFKKKYATTPVLYRKNHGDFII